MYLLDTCIFSEFCKKEPSKKVTQWILERDEGQFSVSVLTFGEIKKGIEKMNDVPRKKKLETWFQEFLIPRFWHRMIVIDGKIANIWGELVAKAEKRGRVIPTIDSLIAATAIAYDLHVVTRNTKDFEGLHLVLINPW